MCSTDTNLLDALPFNNLVNYDIELLFENSKTRIQKLMTDHRLTEYIKEQKLSNMLNSTDYTSCKYYDEEEFIKLGIANHLNVFSLNIRSLPKHGGELSNFINSLKHEFHVIILTEIGARNLSLAENLLPSHHSLKYVIPEKNLKGGVGIYMSKSITNFEIKTNITLEKTCDCTQCEFESLFIYFDYGGQKYVIAGVYRHPNGNVSHFASALDDALSKCDNNRTVIYAADSNINLINYEKSCTENFLTMMLDNKFLPYITLPTRITDTTATCIDHIFVKYPHKKSLSLDTDSGMLFCDVSDHLPCFISLKIPKFKKVRDRPFVRLFGEKNSVNFKTRMLEFNWELLYQNSTDLYSDFFTQTKIFFEKSFPLVTLSRKRSHDKPWITNGLKISIAKNHKLYRISITSSSDHNKKKYQTYNKLLRKCLHEAECLYYHNAFDDKKNSAMNAWKVLGPLINPSKHNKKSTINKIKENGRYFTDKKTISEILNKYFCNIGENLKSNIPNEADSDYKQYMPNSVVNSLNLRPIDSGEVLKEIKRLNPRKACGHDNIGNKILLMCPEVFAHNLTIIYNHYIEIGEYPAALKIAKVIPIYKEGEHALPCNYRPISLLSVFNKIFERLICKQLVHFLEKYKLLYLFQFGYRKLHNTTLALIELTDRIRSSIADGDIALGLFIDFTKAFDTVDHNILLYKLNHYGVRGHANNFFRSYLSNRSQFTVINGVESSIKKITCGVPQGSVLGPILFLIYVNDIHRCVTNCKTRLFADDTSLTICHKDPTELKNIATTQIKNLIKWCNSNKLTINFKKTKYIIFHTRNKYIPDSLQEIVIDGKVIKRVSTIKYLGLFIDELLTWREHVSYIHSSLLKYYGIFNHVKCFVDKKIIRKLYFSFIYSRIKYGIEVYGSCSKTQLHRLQVIQSGLLKILLRKDRRYDTNQLHSDLRILKIVDMYKMQLLMFTNTCLQTKSIPYFNSYFTQREVPYSLRRHGLDPDYANINVGYFSVKNICSRQWNDFPAELKEKSKQLNFRKHIARHYLSFYLQND